MRELTNEDFSKAIAKGKAVVDFWAPWCGPCKMFAPIYEDASKDRPDVLFAKLNTDEQPEAAQQYGIRGIPTLVFFQDGKEVGRVSGVMPKQMFLAKMKEVLG